MPVIKTYTIEVRCVIIRKWNMRGHAHCLQCFTTLFTVFCLWLICTSPRFPFHHLSHLLFAIKNVKVDTTELHSFCHFLFPVILHCLLSLIHSVYRVFQLLLYCILLSFNIVVKPNMRFCPGFWGGVSQFLQADARIVSEIGPWLLTFRSFLMCYLLITLLCNAVQIELLMVLLKTA
jgi:hypothetical protein